MITKEQFNALKPGDKLYGWPYVIVWRNWDGQPLLQRDGTPRPPTLNWDAYTVTSRTKATITLHREPGALRTAGSTLSAQRWNQVENFWLDREEAREWSINYDRVHIAKIERDLTEARERQALLLSMLAADEACNA